MREILLQRAEEKYKNFLPRSNKDIFPHGLLTGWGNVLERVHLSRPHALLHHKVETLNLSFCYRAYDLLTQCCGCGYKVTVEVLYLDAEKEPDFMSESRKAKINTEKERKKM
jgi:hypothetical protein